MRYNETHYERMHYARERDPHRHGAPEDPIDSEEDQEGRCCQRYRCGSDRSDLHRNHSGRRKRRDRGDPHGLTSKTSLKREATNK